MVRAAVFDLWNTLVPWPDKESRALRRRWASLLGVTPERVDELWYADGAYERRESGPIAAALKEIHDAVGYAGGVDDVLGWRLDLARRALEPADDVVAALEELRRRGLATGLISNCTEDVALVWGESSLARLFDVAVFSASAGVMKPAPRIYERALEELGEAGSATLFVGDGANDELEGARAAGMTPVLIDADGSAPGWVGLRITAVPHVLDLIS